MQNPYELQAMSCISYNSKLDVSFIKQGSSLNHEPKPGAGYFFPYNSGNRVMAYRG